LSCPLLGVERTSFRDLERSANDAVDGSSTWHASAMD
jgi:hypothetical protein